MYVYRNIKWSVILRFAWAKLLLFAAWACIVVYGYHYYEHMNVSLRIPFLPLSTIGIAVAFYVGFKNNAAYDRFWEARKIWGGIVNYSRTWANQVLNFVTMRNAKGEISSEELKEVQRDLIYRHIAYINAVRLKLRKPNPQRAKANKMAEKKFYMDAPEMAHWKAEVCDFLQDGELERLRDAANKPTQLILKQGEELRKLMEEKGLIEDFRHMEMMRVLEEFYNLQGKCERIKSTPFPRQYAYFSKVFTWIFIILLPLGLVGQFAEISHNMMWAAVPFSVLISWIFNTMEVVGDNSEDPFENFINDVPMTAICRTIEIDLRQMLGETDLPPSIEPVDGILM